MPICQECGGNVSEGGKFCGSCGSPVEAPGLSASFPGNDTVNQYTPTSMPANPHPSQQAAIGVDYGGQTYQQPQGSMQPIQPQGALPDSGPETEPKAGCLSSILGKVLSAALVFVVAGSVGYCSFGGKSVGVRGGDTVVSSSSAAATSDSANTTTSSSSAASTSSTAQNQNTTVCEYSGVRYKVPSSWVEEKGKDGGYHYRVQYSSGTNFTVDTFDIGESLSTYSADDVDAFAQLYRQILEEEGATDINAQTLNIEGHPAMRFSFEWYHEREDDDKTAEYRFEIDELVFMEGTVVELGGVCSASERSKWEDSFTAVLSSITIA